MNTRVACYVRVSTDEQVKYGFSIQAQIDALTKYCKENKLNYSFFIDEGISASSMKRPALQEMLSKASIFDMILFTKLDRLSRNVLDANNINKILKENNCVMKAIDEDDVDTSTADGTFIFNLKVSLAQREIGKTSERINFVFRNKREKGEITSGSKKYGYDIVDKHYVINPEEADNIKKLYNYFIEVNGNIKKTYIYFTSIIKNKSYDALHAYLKDTAYIGKYKLYRKNVYLDNYIPAILSEDTFSKVQNLLIKKGHSTQSNYNGLFDGLLYCSECGAKLTKKIDNRVKNKTVRYACWKSKAYQVGKLTHYCNQIHCIREDYIEKYLLNNIKVEAQNYVISSKKIMEQEEKIDNTTEIKKIQRKLEKLKDLYLDDLIDRELYNKDYKKYNEQLSSLLALKKNESKSQRDLSQIEKIINLDLTMYNKLTRENKRKFWLSIIDKIYIKDQKIQKIIFL